MEPSEQTPTAMTRVPLLPDAAARQTILENLDENIVVEAAAGTGKTTSLVGRIMNLMRRGHVSPASRFAAVTFTTKAAAELRQRLERELDLALDSPAVPPRERARLARAKAALPDCHMGTIHSFCARLLRERPVEAGVSPDFREIDPDADAVYRRRAWDEFARRLVSGGHPALYRAFELFGLDLDTLAAGFARFADFPDIQRWPGLDASTDHIDLDAFNAGVAAFTSGLDRLQPALADAPGGTDTLIPILQSLHRRLRRAPVGDLEQAFQLSRALKPGAKQILRQWTGSLVADKEQAKEEHARYTRFVDDVVLPFRNQCLAAVYAASLLAFREAADIYDRLRRNDGALNFQDLLMLTAAMLREYPEVREDLAGHYPRLLVDEVQDTDPVQAEIMFLIAAEDSRRAHWRLSVPRPGSLFIVGDPKQSIYRFRRADIVVYQEVKRRIVQTGGRQVDLTSNFRSQPAVLDWVNLTFQPDGEDATPEETAESGRFGSAPSAYGPGYVPLRSGRPGAANAWSGVFYLETLSPGRKEGISEKDAVDNEAARIAAFIRHAVDSGLPLPAGTGTRPAEPGDFLIVTYQKAKAPPYAAALRRLGLECRVSAGGTLADSPALHLLLPYLDSLRHPDDGIRLLAVLRGGLFGIADTELYRWKKAEREFSFAADSGSPEASPLAAALELMRGHHRLFSREEPCRALARVVDELGLWEYASLGDHPADSVGALAAALEAMNAMRSGLPTLGSLHERLAWLRDTYDGEAPPARETEGRAVRVMNLHKTKGLEAPVVFLTSTRTLRRRSATFAVKRSGEEAEGALAMYGGEFGNLPLARPRMWDEAAAEEELFLAAERTRLNYVAATRAGAALVVSVHKAGSVWKSAFVPGFVAGETIPAALPEPEAAALPKPEAAAAGEAAPVDPGALLAAAAARDAGRSALTTPTYGEERAKPGSGLAGIGAEEREREEERGGDSNRAVAMGEMVHRLVDAGAERDEGGLLAMAREIVEECGYPKEWAGELAGMAAGLRRSELWRRVEGAEKVFREAPFTRRMEGDGGKMVLRRGIIDLVFRENGAWVIVEYKSDSHIESGEPGKSAAKYAGQLGAYAEAWAALTGERVAETGVFFLRHKVYAPL